MTDTKSKYMIDHYVIEYRNVIPIQSTKYELNELSITQLFEWTERVGHGMAISFHQAGSRLIIYAESEADYLKLCHRDGICGICGKELDPNQNMPERSKIYQKGYECCAYCGNILREKKATGLLDLFNFLTKPEVKEI